MWAKSSRENKNLWDSKAPQIGFPDLLTIASRKVVVDRNRKGLAKGGVVQHFNARLFGRAVSSVVEHYLDTVSPDHDSDKRQSLNGESPLLRPDFCPDPGAKSRRRTSRFVRIARGLYRYGGTGEIYACEKVEGRNRWRKLNTTDKKRAMAIKAIFSYAEAQNGNHVVMVVPDQLSKDAGVLPGNVIQRISSEEARPAAATRRSMTIRALIEELKSQWKHLAPSTQKVREAYLNALTPHLDINDDISSLTPSALRKLRGGLTKGRKASSVNDIMTKAVRPLLDLAVELGLLEKSPLDAIKALKKESPIRLQPTWKESLAIIAEVEKSSPESATLLRVMLFFGVGQAEIKGVPVEHVDLEKQCVHFFRQKTRKEYVVPILPHAKEFIATLMKEKVVPGQPLFKWRNPRKALESACAELKLPKYTPRALRRTFIIQCLEKGVDARMVAKWQGHADAKLILDTYGNYISVDHAKAQIAKME